MALTDNGGTLSAADVAAVLNGRGGNGGFGGWGADGGWWILLLFLFAMGGWGNNGWGGNGNGVMPFMMAQGGNADLQRGLDNQTTLAAISGVREAVGNGFADAAVAQCSGNAAITAAVTGAQFATANAITGAKDTVITTMNANQNATTAGMNALAMSLQNCCCENRAATADLKYTVATEACADRTAVSNGVRDLIASNTANTQAILDSQRQGFQSINDKLCQLELDSFKQKVADQAAEIAALRGTASQTAQTAALIANNDMQTANLLQRLNPNPVPAYIVQNPNGCGCMPVNYGCGCGA